jgi:hypothetical protein
MEGMEEEKSVPVPDALLVPRPGSFVRLLQVAAAAIQRL